MRETIRNSTFLPLAAAFASAMFAGCISDTDPSGSTEVADVGEVSSELGAAGSSSDAWKFPNQRGDLHNRNFCPLVAAFANPTSVRVGQKLDAIGFAFDFDRRPQALKYKWTASPAIRGSFDNATAKSTKFKCLTAGNAQLTFAASDGDCTRTWVVNVNCKPVTTPVCGNGVVEGNETCDGNCPTAATCNDNQGCTKDVISGSASQCTAVCAHTAITMCVAGDSCCPSSCSNATDADCTPTQVCGNNVREGTETCDGNCPASCDDHIACTKDVRTGTPEACNVMCSNTAISACSTTSDGCCPAGCNALNDADCTPNCGNGAVEMGETCDPQSSCPTACNDGVACTKDTLNGAASTCNAACTFTTINTCVNGDGCCPQICSNTNDSDCPPPQPRCGNGVLDSGETCDNSSPTKCPASCDDGVACTANVPSGDPATCDFKCDFPAITVCTATSDGCCPPPGSGCNTSNDFDCTARCGDGVVSPPETCDGNCPTTCDDGDACTADASSGAANTCNVVCTHTAITTPECLCGNGRIDTGETCDGNCPTTCEDSNPCTTDTLNNAGTCTAVCVHTPITTPACLCNNGTLDTGETCDNSSATPCPTSCPPGPNACVVNELQGDASSCSARCVPRDLACGANGDGCCPGSCTSTQDNDCHNACADCHTADPFGLCVQPLADCDAIQGVTGPNAPFRPNTPRNQLCREIVTCMETQHCAGFAATDCLCGAGVAPDACFNGTFDAMSGLCKEVMAAGMESTVTTEMAVRISDQNFATGAAVAVIEICDQLSCSAECL